MCNTIPLSSSMSRSSKKNPLNLEKLKKGTNKVLRRSCYEIEYEEKDEILLKVVSATLMVVTAIGVRGNINTFQLSTKTTEKKNKKWRKITMK